MKRTYNALIDLDRRRRQMPSMSASAFSCMVSDIKRNGLPELHADDPGAMRNLARQARDALLSTDTQYGPMLHAEGLANVTPGKPPVVLEHVNVQAYFQYIYGLGGSFMHLIDAMHARRPSTPEAPWGLIVYSDEVDPGQELAARNERKLYAFYAAIRECGPLILSNSDAWITLATQPSHELRQVEGGFPAVMSVLLESMFVGRHSLRLAGVLLVAPDGTQKRIWLDLSMFLMDGAAHKDLWCVKGDGGMFFCMMCPEVCTRSSDLVKYEGGRFLISDFLPEDMSKCATATDASIRATVRRLADYAAANSPDMLLKRQMVVGMNHNPHNILLNPRLTDVVKPETQFCHDGMHCLLSSGVINVLVVCLLDKAKSVGINAAPALEAFVKRFKWPVKIQSKIGKGLYEVFSPSRVSRSIAKGSLVCTASELLSLLPVLANFTRKYLLDKPGMRDAAECVLAGLDVAETVFRGGVTPEILQTRVETFASLIVVAGWTDWMIPKFHWLAHLPRHLFKFGFLPNAFVTELKHKSVKAEGLPIRNTRAYQRGVLAEVTAAHAAAMASPSTFDKHVGLVEPRPAPAKMCQYLQSLFDDEHQFRTAYHARFAVEGDTCAKGDVVLLKDGGPHLRAAEVWFHFDVADEPASLVSIWECIEFNAESKFALWRKVDAPRIVLLDDIVGVCIHVLYEDGIVKTLLPHRV